MSSFPTTKHGRSCRTRTHTTGFGSLFSTVLKTAALPLHQAPTLLPQRPPQIKHFLILSVLIQLTTAANTSITNLLIKLLKTFLSSMRTIIVSFTNIILTTWTFPISVSTIIFWSRSAIVPIMDILIPIIWFFCIELYSNWIAAIDTIIVKPFQTTSICFAPLKLVSWSAHVFYLTFFVIKTQ